MTIEFAAYLDAMEPSSSDHRVALEAACKQAARLMSAQGLQTYLQGIVTLSALGKSRELVYTYIEEMPEVARELGEDVVVDTLHAVMQLSSLTSGSVITLILVEMPLAARRLGDAALFKAYLNLLHQLASRAPRGLRPMMENLDQLLAKLTLGGLRRWALWGAQAHARDPEGQTRYFGLQSESSRAVLKRERRGCLLIDHQRKLGFYLRALWGRAFYLRPTSGDYEQREGLRPYIEDFQILLPDAYDSIAGVEGLEMYRAAVAHCAAHLVHTRRALEREQCTPLEQLFVGLFEDARVEFLAMQEFPGLQKLWLQCFLQSGGEQADKHPVVGLMLDMARQLLEQHSHGNAAMNSLADDFHARLLRDAHDPRVCIQAGKDFFNFCAGLHGMPALRLLQHHAPIYRDDNRYSWNFTGLSAALEQVPGLDTTHQLRRNVSVMEMVNNLDNELAGDDAQEIWTLSTPFWLDQEGCTINQLEGKEPVSEPYLYPEWDYQMQLSRPDWVTLTERRQPRGDAAAMDQILQQHKPIAARIRHLIDALQPQGVVRKRGYEEGEELDLNAAVSAMVEIRRGTQPDPRINIRVTRQLRDLSILVLMDLSESTNEKINQMDELKPQPTILSLTREATGLLAWAVDAIGDAFAIHGFASDGRHDVQYYRFKDFDQPYDDAAKARLAGMRGGLSTRMGAALRHAGSHLQKQSARKRLVLLVTDGEPADVDERDPQYLRHDAKKAVEELATQGIHSYCLTLDPDADRYVARIFGENNFAIVDHVERLPERLPSVFAALTS